MARRPDESSGEVSLETTRMPILAHLRELRKRIIVCLVAVVVGIGIAFFFSNPIWDWLAAPMQLAMADGLHGDMAVLTPIEGMIVYLKVSVAAGFFVAAPVVFFQIWKFVAPGLYPREKRYILPLVATSWILFIGGVAFGYYAILPYTFPVFLAVTEGTAQAMVSMQSYFTTIIWLLASFGASFELPVIVFVLARMGLVNAWDLIRWFRYSIVGIFVVAAIITPPDVISQVVMAVPLTVLYFLSVGVAALFTTKKRRVESPEESPAA